jgi:hypothetical protein
MKGPYERLKYDLRRVWECPVCKRRERTPGSVTSRHCLCQMKQADGAPVVMKLLEDGPRRVLPRPPAPATAREAEAATRDAEAPAAPSAGPAAGQPP